MFSNFLYVRSLSKVAYNVFKISKIFEAIIKDRKKCRRRFKAAGVSSGNRLVLEKESFLLCRHLPRHRLVVQVFALAPPRYAGICLGTASLCRHLPLHRLVVQVFCFGVQDFTVNPPRYAGIDRDPPCRVRTRASACRYWCSGVQVYALV